MKLMAVSISILAVAAAGPALAQHHGAGAVGISGGFPGAAAGGFPGRGATQSVFPGGVGATPPVNTGTTVSGSSALSAPAAAPLTSFPGQGAKTTFPGRGATNGSFPGGTGAQPTRGHSGTGTDDTDTPR